MKKLLFVASLIGLAACNTEDMVISKFSNYPEEVDGIGCTYKTAKEDTQYVFMSTSSGVGFARINDKEELLQLVTTRELKNGHFRDLYKNVNYELTLETINTDTVDYSTYQKGSITIKSKGKEAASINILGDCGC